MGLPNGKRNTESKRYPTRKAALKTPALPASPPKAMIQKPFISNSPEYMKDQASGCSQKIDLLKTWESKKLYPPAEALNLVPSEFRKTVR